MMQQKSKYIGMGIVIGFFIMGIPLGNTLGQNSGLESNNLILMNIACSLPENEFETVINGLAMPEDFKAMLGDNHQEAWELYKSNLFKQCFL